MTAAGRVLLVEFTGGPLLPEVYGVHLVEIKVGVRRTLVKGGERAVPDRVARWCSRATMVGGCG